MVTPLQLLNAYAALANGGTLYRPQLVKSILDEDGDEVEEVEPEVIRKLDIDRSVLRSMRIAARRVVTVPAHVQPGGPADRHGRQVGYRGIRHSGQAGPAAVPLTGSRHSSRRTSGRSPATRTAPRRSRARTPTSSSSRSSTTPGPPAMPRPRSSSTSCSSTMGCKVDLRQRWVLERANFYGG